MEWLLEQTEAYRAQIRRNPFFQRVQEADHPRDLIWVHQLLHQSREFTQALCLRNSLCRDRAYQGIFAEHAREEADHPDQLIAWMTAHGFLNGVEAGDALATPETADSLAFCWRSALHDTHATQIVTFNVLSEGVALDFYSAIIPVLEKLDLLTGRYWKVHREVDAHHMQMGVDRLGDVVPTSPRGARYRQALWHAASHYDRMLASWVGATVAPLAKISIEESLECPGFPPRRSVERVTALAVDA